MNRLARNRNYINREHLCDFGYYDLLDKKFNLVCPKIDDKDGTSLTPEDFTQVVTYLERYVKHNANDDGTYDFYEVYSKELGDSDEYMLVARIGTCILTPNVNNQKMMDLHYKTYVDLPIDQLTELYNILLNAHKFTNIPCGPRYSRVFGQLYTQDEHDKFVVDAVREHM